MKGYLRVRNEISYKTLLNKILLITMVKAGIKQVAYNSIQVKF